MEPKKLLEQIRSIPESRSFSRTMEVIKESIDLEKSEAEFSVTSEYPVRRYYGYEILDHKPTSIRTKRLENGAAHKDTHYGDQLGAVVGYTLDQAERKLRVKVRFSKNNERAQLVLKDMFDGIRTTVSCYYDIYAFELEKDEEGIRTYRITDWEPVHTCNEADPADWTVGAGRSKEAPTDEPMTEAQIIELAKRNKINIEIINPKRAQDFAPQPEEVKVELTAEEKRKLEEEKQRSINDGIKQEMSRQNAIRAIAGDEFVRNNLGKNVDIAKEMQAFLDDNTRSAQDFQSHIFQLMKSTQATRASSNHLDMPNSDIKNYSMRKIILAQATNDYTDLGVELESHRELIKRNGLPPTNGMYVPEEIQKRRIALRGRDFDALPSEMRNFLVGNQTAGGYTVKTEYLPLSFQELLQQNTPFLNAGTEFITGVKGTIPITRELSGLQFYWAGEGEGPASSSMTFAQETLSPKKGGAKTKYSYEFLTQSSLSVEAYVERKLAICCSEGLNHGIAYADGLNNKIKGLKYIAGIGATDCAVGGFTLKKALEMSGRILDNGTGALGEPKWIGRGSLRELMKAVEKFDGTGKTMVDENNKLNGLDFSNVAGNIAAGELFLGIWPLLMLFYWNQLEILANPFGAGYAAGDTEVRALLSVDLWCERPQAFELASGITIA